MSQKVETEVTINAPADVVWQILTDFANYGDWNRMMPRVEGEPRLGSRLTINVKMGKRRAVTFKTRLIAFEAPRALCWKGTFAIRGIASGEHGFYIEPLEAGRVRFVHSEIFRGLAMPLLFPLLHRELRASFEAMNKALKRRAEAAVADSEISS